PVSPGGGSCQSTLRPNVQLLCHATVCPVTSCTFCDKTVTSAAGFNGLAMVIQSARTTGRRGMPLVELGEDDGLVTVDEDAVGQVQAHSAGEDHGLEVP